MMYKVFVIGMEIQFPDKEVETNGDERRCSTVSGISHR